MTFADRISTDPAHDSAESSLFVEPDVDFLKDHFPGAPMLPGLVMLESAVRAAAALWSARHPTATREGVVLDAVERLYVVRRVVPGETVSLQVSLTGAGAGGGTASFLAHGIVAGETAIRIHFRLRALQAGQDRWDSSGGTDDDARPNP